MQFLFMRKRSVHTDRGLPAARLKRSKHDKRLCDSLRRYFQRAEARAAAPPKSKVAEETRARRSRWGTRAEAVQAVPVRCEVMGALRLFALARLGRDLDDAAAVCESSCAAE